MTASYQCRVCGSSNTEYLGPLPEQAHFAGRLPAQKLPESGLYQCRSCLLLVRHPILSIVEYNTLYAQADSKVWSKNSVNLRPDQGLARNIILNKFKGVCKVLDIGCYTGDLLSSLPENFLKYGVEMSTEASVIASAKGINIIGNDLYNIKTNDKFDFILSVDIIEHTCNPEEFLNKLSTLLEIDGEIFISTGNCDHWFWQHLKNRFWYSRFPEHISFIGMEWLEKFCKNNNFTITDKYFFNYSPNNIKSFIKNIIKFILSIIRVFPEYLSNTTRDHFCFILKPVKTR